MAYFKGTESAEALVVIALDLMKTERAAIVSGSFEAVYNLTEEKTALLNAIDARFSEIAKLEKTPELEVRLAQLHHLALALSHNASSNQRLLEAAQASIKKTQQELQAAAVKSDPGFYAASGKKIAVASPYASSIRKF